MVSALVHGKLRFDEAKRAVPGTPHIISGSSPLPHECGSAMAQQSISDDMLFLSVRDLGQRLRKGQIAPVALTEAYLQRLEKFGDRLGAVVTILRKQALAEARNAEKEIKGGRYRGPLHGIPYGVKDLVATCGTPTTWGAAPYRKQVFDYDGTVVRRLREAGAILVAKLAMVELAGAFGYNNADASFTGPGRNPWNLDYWAGGSSSGPGAAVAAALVPFAIGSETSGSIITPAAYCGVSGLRPTYGRVSRHGAMALSWTCDKLGPLCRSAVDCGLVLHAISGRDWQDPSSSGQRFYYLENYGRPLNELRIGYAPADFHERAAEQARPALQAALDVFRGISPKLSEILLPPMPYADVISTIIQSEAAAIFESLIKSDRLDLMPDEYQKAGLRAALDIPARDYLNAMRVRRLMQENIRLLFRQVDVILSASRAGPASGINEPLDHPGQPPALSAPPGNGSLIQAGNLAGLPAISLPCGFSTGANLPIAVQLVGKPFDELTLITLGREFQRRTDWHLKRPPVA